MSNFVGLAGIDTAEHSAKSGSKKTILGPLSLAADPASENQSIAPLSVSAGSPITLLRGKTYRVIGTGAWNLRMYNIGTTAPTLSAADVYVPANVAIVIKADSWNAIATFGAGTIQAVELA